MLKLFLSEPLVKASSINTYHIGQMPIIPLMSQVLKRFLDIALAGVAIVGLSPLLVAIGVLVYRCVGPPIIFKQKRPGQFGKPITILKFRTMNDDCNSKGELLPDAERLTPFGRYLRSTSLDELPELINILKGDMSIVGPRPLLMQYLERYTPAQARRHDVKPGLTGWAQINGRNAITWEEKFYLDTWYVDHQSIWLDLAIIVATIKQVFHREGINFAGEATMPEFMGSTLQKGTNTK